MTSGPPAAENPRPLDVAGMITLLLATGAAVLIYMGWAYLDGYLRPFLLRPTSLNFRPDEYALFGLNLFTPEFVPWMAAAPLILAAFTHRAKLSPLLPARLHTLAAALRAHPAVRPLGNVTGVGAVITLIALLLALGALRGRAVGTNLLLILIILGSLLLTWPSRRTPLGRIGYAVAITISIFCLLWMTSLYAQERGARSARILMDQLPYKPQVALYTADTLALNAPMVQRETLGKGTYKYRYLGLHLLLIRGETYYLIPEITAAQWEQGHGRAFVFKEEDDIRVEILPGTRPG
ncbi:hypothetical protein DP939_23430 [Spongiactinospora rosea]|uniref:Uncharacterized protein n=1 Tax=Spongiactinospora rosea TaxID=2248750 RepID=A0A366LWW9_9ACTN|nr:hypothetical protein [Spongiactinospora rosea]RBQ17814.1 hypothetical protein DP939_23430 [Spongiactinospora rosea]